MEKEIIEGNKLIAHYMGLKPYKSHSGPQVNKQVFSIGRREHLINNLYYHSSWDWLMPVMEKIGKEYNVRITWTAHAIEVTYIDRPDVRDDNSLADFGGFAPITNTWKCAVKFIQWYNTKYKIKNV